MWSIIYHQTFALTFICFSLTESDMTKNLASRIPTMTQSQSMGERSASIDSCEPLFQIQKYTCRSNNYIISNKNKQKNYKAQVEHSGKTEKLSRDCNYEQYLRDCQYEDFRLKNLRSWYNTTLGNQLSNATEFGQVFTLLSYNILAQDLLESHNYLYRRHDPRALIWTHRFSKLLTEIITNDAEIVCLQEVQLDHLREIAKPLIKLNYDYVYKQRTNDYTDGSAIFYKKKIFILEEHKLIEYFRPSHELLSKDNVGIIVKLQFKEKHPKAQPGNNSFIVATTHLLYNPKRSDIRLAQTQLMLAEIDKMAYLENSNGRPTYLPVILTGDFNLQPKTPVYDFITKGKLQYSHLKARVLTYPEANITEDTIQGNLLISPEVGITDNCQYLDVYLTRSKNKISSDGARKSDNSCDRLDIQPLFNTGSLHHTLNLKSTYLHKNKYGTPEASTFQDSWITVDYIFYSQVFSAQLNKLVEGRLKLLSRVELPSVDRCKFMGNVPNLKYGSDHLCLMAQFVLR